MNTFDSLLLNLLNIKSSDIQEIVSTVDDTNHQVIFLSFVKKENICIYCGSQKCTSKGYYSKRIKLPNNALHNIDVVLKIRRHKCENCGKSFKEDYSLFPTRSSVSYSMIQSIMKSLLSPTSSFTAVADLHNLSVNKVISIFDKYCHFPKPKKFPEIICIDEVYTKHSNYDSKFSCVFYDFIKHSIIDITPSRHKRHLHSYFQLYEKEALDNVKYVCIDMYRTYKDISRFYFKKAIICVDSFHVIKLLNDSLSKLRVSVQNKYETNSLEYYLLKTFRNLVLSYDIDLDNKGKYNKRFKRIINYRELLNYILAIDPALEKAYELRNYYIHINRTYTYDQYKAEYDVILNKFANSGIKEFEPFTIALSNWGIEITNSFIRYNGIRISNGIAESLNTQIKSIIYNSKGIYNHDRRRKRIMYSINKNGAYL